VPELELCMDCERPMRPRKTTKRQYPGTVLKASMDRCSTCYVSRRRTNTMTDMPLRVKSSKAGPEVRTSRSQGVKLEVVPDADISQTPCVLVRTDLSPATYKALVRAHGEGRLGLVLASLANQYVASLSAERQAS
jgi:hypothetical protein